MISAPSASYQVLPKPSRSSGGGGGRKVSAATWLSLILLCVACWAIGYGLGVRQGTLSQPATTQQPAIQSASQPAASEPAPNAAKLTIKAYTDTADIVPKIRTVASSYVRQQRCDDTCFKAKDGVCQDGRDSTPDTINEVLCDLGSDCTDCGPYNGYMLDDLWYESGPVDYLKRQADAKILQRTTITNPPFQMWYTDPEADLDVSQYIHKNGILEAGITKIFETILKNECVDPSTGRRRLVLDVGANFGYFTVYAAMMGCRVIAWEPVPHNRAFLASNLAINNLTNLVTVRPQVVSDEDKKLVTMLAPKSGIWGTASVAGINRNGNGGLESQTVELTVATERIDSVVKDEDVLLMKVDVEGFEPLVMKSAETLIRNRKIENIIFEYSPGIAERSPYLNPTMTHLITATPQMLMDMLLSGYQMGLMLDHISKGQVLDDIPLLPQIQPTQLMYDIQDAATYTSVHTAIANKDFASPTKAFFCPPKEELVALNDVWAVCDKFPEAAHPKSVRSSFYYNTNIWASLTTKHIRLSYETPSVLQLSDDAHRVWHKDGDTAMGARDCRYIPIKDMVRFRCSCHRVLWRRDAREGEYEKCMVEQELVNRYMRDGTFKFQDNEHPILPARVIRRRKVSRRRLQLHRT